MFKLELRDNDSGILEILFNIEVENFQNLINLKIILLIILKI